MPSTDRVTVTHTAYDVAASLRHSAASAPGRAARVTRHYTTLLVTRIQGRASGRPGPRAVTGDYRRSWHAWYTFGHNMVIGYAGTAKPQGPRLEHGYVGTDSLGRSYSQPPFEHAVPALNGIGPDYLRALNHGVAVFGPHLRNDPAVARHAAADRSWETRQRTGG